MLRLVWMVAIRIVALMLGAGYAVSHAAELRVGLSSEPNSIDPHYHALQPNNTVAAHIFESLTRLDADARVVPGLAESWRLIDETTWEFKLRKGVRFHDGGELTAEDVAWSLDRPATIKNSPGPFTLYTKQITDKEIIDPLTIRLKTAAPYRRPDRP
jgi:peptide/nickel transport system substrate-binding protein